MKRISLLVFALISIIGRTQDKNYVLRPGAEGKDALIWSIEPNNNFGDLSKFLCMAWTFGGTPGIDRSLIQFDFSPLPVGQTIEKASLSLYYKDLEPNITFHTGENLATLRLITEPWDEHTVTWNNAPSTTSAHQVMLHKSNSATENYLDIDVTEAMRLLYSDPDTYYGLELRLLNEQSFTCLLFASSDIDQVNLRPKLEITLKAELNVLFDYDAIGRRAYQFNNLSIGQTAQEWSFGDGDHSSEENPIHAYQTDGDYKVCLTVSNNSEQKTYCQDIHICLNEIQGSFLPELRGGVCTFENETINSDINYWDFGDGYYSNERNPVHVYETSGEFNVTLTATNNCSSKSISKIVKLKYPESTNIREFDWVLLFPNPSNGEFKMRTNYTGKLKLEIYELDGKLVVSDQIRTTAMVTEEYRVKLMSGVYELLAWSDQTFFRKKIVIIKD